MSEIKKTPYSTMAPSPQSAGERAPAREAMPAKPTMSQEPVAPALTDTVGIDEPPFFDHAARVNESPALRALTPPKERERAPGLLARLAQQVARALGDSAMFEHKVVMKATRGLPSRERPIDVAPWAPAATARGIPKALLPIFADLSHRLGDAGWPAYQRLEAELRRSGIGEVTLAPDPMWDAYVVTAPSVVDFGDAIHRACARASASDVRWTAIRYGDAILVRAERAK